MVKMIDYQEVLRHDFMSKAVEKGIFMLEIRRFPCQMGISKFVVEWLFARSPEEIAV